MTHGDPSGHGLLVARGYAPLALAAYLLCGWIHGEPWERRIEVPDWCCIPEQARSMANLAPTADPVVEEDPGVCIYDDGTCEQ